MTWGNGRGAVARAWIGTLVAVFAVVMPLIWGLVATHFQARENARAIERIEQRVEIDRQMQLQWLRTYSYGGGE